MEYHNSGSSMISKFGHDAELSELTVHFRNGGIYVHEGVSSEDYEEMKAAESHGKHYNNFIKGKFPSRRI